MGVGCTSSTDAPPIYLPAPTGVYLGVTAPDVYGNAIVYGYIYADNEPRPGVTVTVTNNNTTAQASTTTSDTAYFEVIITAEVGHTLKVKYAEPTTGRESTETELIVSNDTQTMSSDTMVPYDVAGDLNDGQAILAANDGTNSEIIKADLATGQIIDRANFLNVTFDKIAIHNGRNHAAVLDTANRMLYWYDISNLSDGMAPTSWDNLNSEPIDVAVVQLNDTPWTTDDMVVVSHNRNESDYGILSIYAIGTGETPTLGFPTTTNCIGHPSDTTTYPNCTANSNPKPSKATEIDLTKMSTNQAAIAMLVEYDNDDKVIHFVSFNQAFSGAPITLNLSAGGYDSGILPAGSNPYALKWYDDNNALMTDIQSGDLLMFTAGSGSEITTRTLAIGTGIRSLATDSDNNRVFVADQTSNTVLNIDMTNFGLNGTTYGAKFNPTGLVYYQQDSADRLGVILTSPRPMFKTIVP